MLTIKTNLRVYKKKSATRRLRKQNKCPAIIYSKGDEPNISIMLNQNNMLHPDIKTQLYKNNIILLFIEEYKQTIEVKVQEIQYHPFKPKLIHIDFARV
ncbi:50S ribosomal protein L25 [Blochmannia endosymbiont of Camponotus nipponensis]|uniref:50S ribosomal protein L25 n=1 Tax=Blochmannia endosymbiont of Camponotus nipponensis TaxID=2681986 RepID=UPI001358666D|nr:50S ribosomal protein L25 [Blochmannia endosymbiont of Camponotus nipponensis]